MQIFTKMFYHHSDISVIAKQYENYTHTHTHTHREREQREVIQREGDEERERERKIASKKDRRREVDKGRAR